MSESEVIKILNEYPMNENIVELLNAIKEAIKLIDEKNIRIESLENDLINMDYRHKRQIIELERSKTYYQKQHGEFNEGIIEAIKIITDN